MSPDAAFFAAFVTALSGIAGFFLVREVKKNDADHAEARRRIALVERTTAKTHYTVLAVEQNQKRQHEEVVAAVGSIDRSLAELHEMIWGLATVKPLRKRPSR